MYENKVFINEVFFSFLDLNKDGVITETDFFMVQEVSMLNYYNLIQ